MKYQHWLNPDSYDFMEYAPYHSLPLCLKYFLRKILLSDGEGSAGKSACYPCQTALVQSLEPMYKAK